MSRSMKSPAVAVIARAAMTATFILAVLAGCGSGTSSNWEASDSSSDTDASTSTAIISGTVAAGAPVIGLVEAKGSNGATKQAQISSDGSFQLGLRGLALPILLRAVGYVGGTKVSLTSAATAADADGTVNITPFTDLMIASIAGQSGSAFYENPNFDLISATSLDVARVAVTQRIEPVLAELAIDESFDLRTTPFAADHTGFDSVLDMLHVELDAANDTAIIRDIVNDSQIVDDLSTTSDRDVLAVPPPGSYADAIADLSAIDAVFARLNTLFAAQIPAADNPELLSLFDTDFVYDGSSLAEFLSGDNLLSTANIGVQLVNPTLLSRSADNRTVRVSVQVLDTLGNVIAYDRVDSDELEMRLDAGGNWRIAGNRRLGDVSISSINVADASAATTSYARAMEYWIPSARADVAFVRFSGPGLPASTSYADIGAVSGILFERGSDGNFGLLDTSGTILDTFWLPECPAPNTAIPCITLADVASNAVYTVTFLDASMAAVGDVTDITVPAPPLENANAQAQAARWFASFATPYPASFTELADQMLFRLAWQNPDDIAYSPVEIQLRSGDTVYHQALSGSETSKTMGTWSGAAPDVAPRTWLITSGLLGREFVTGSTYPQ